MMIHRLAAGRTRLPFCNLFHLPRVTRPSGREALAASCVSTLGDAAVFFLDEQGGADRLPLPRQHICAYMLAPGPDGRLYVGAGNGDILRIDLAADRVDTLVTGELRSIVWGGVVAPNGRLIATAMHEAHAAAIVYDIHAERVIHRYEPFAEASCCGHHWHRRSDGRYLCVVSSPQPRIVIWDPDTLDTEVHTPGALAAEPFASTTALLPDDALLVVQHGSPGVVLSPESFEPQRQLGPSPGPKGLVGNPVALDGRLYASDAIRGGVYRLDDMGQWALVHEGLPDDPLVMGTLDQHTVTGVSALGLWHHYDPEANTFESRPIENRGHMTLCAMYPGPDKQVYAATFINNRFCRFDPSHRQFQDMGRVARHGGEVLAMTEFNGRIYMASYVYATLNVYDPARPAAYPENPRPVAEFGHEQHRPRAIVADDRFLYVATGAIYGRLGGAVTVFDPDTEACEVYRHLVRNQNVTSLVLDAHEHTLYGGTNARPEAAEPTEAAGAFFSWDTHQRRKLYHEMPWPDAEQVTVLVITHQGHLLGADDQGRYFLWDTHIERFVRREPMPLTGVLFDAVPGSNGRVYAAGSDGLWRWDLERRRARRLVHGSARCLHRVDHVLYFLLDGRELVQLQI
jgi:hypothetical protein